MPLTGEEYVADYDTDQMLLARYKEWITGGMCECCQAVHLEANPPVFLHCFDGEARGSPCKLSITPCTDSALRVLEAEPSRIAAGVFRDPTRRDEGRCLYAKARPPTLCKGRSSRQS